MLNKPVDYASSCTNGRYTLRQVGSKLGIVGWGKWARSAILNDRLLSI